MIATPAMCHHAEIEFSAREELDAEQVDQQVRGR